MQYTSSSGWSTPSPSWTLGTQGKMHGGVNGRIGKVGTLPPTILVTIPTNGQAGTICKILIKPSLASKIWMCIYDREKMTNGAGFQYLKCGSLIFMEIISAAVSNSVNITTSVAVCCFSFQVLTLTLTSPGLH